MTVQISIAVSLIVVSVYVTARYWANGTPPRDFVNLFVTCASGLLTAIVIVPALIYQDSIELKSEVQLGLAVAVLYMGQLIITNLIERWGERSEASARSKRGPGKVSKKPKRKKEKGASTKENRSGRTSVSLEEIA